MKLRLLGPFEAQHEDQVVDVGRRQERLLLALLALEGGRPVTTERLTELIWEGRPPVSARAAIHTYVARLRSALKPFGRSIASRGHGYAIDGAGLDVDALEMASLCRLAAQTDAASERARLLDAALSLWRGPLLSDLAGEQVRRRIGTRYDDLHLEAMVSWAGANLALGRPDLVVGRLADALEEHLVSDRLVAVMMTALYRSGRRGDALALYERARVWVADELGLDPAPALARLHLLVLRDDPELAGVPATPAVRGPNQLPRAVPDFVGRGRELQAIDRLVTDARAGIITITAIGGMSGVGKTATALQWAHEAGHHFPDGRFFVNLRGYDVEAPLTTIEALTYLLRALGVPNEAIPADEAGASAVYRSRLADRRALVVLDNARSADQVRPLVPGTTSSVVLVTSRDHLTGLVARDGARLHVLDVLTPHESIELLERIVGATRIQAEPADADRIAHLVGHLPLALRIVGAHLALRPEHRIADFATVLADNRLDGLDVPDDPRTSIRRLFQLSYDELDAPTRRMFRLLGAAPIADITAPAAARLADLPEVDARSLLRRLADLSLLAVSIDTLGPDRYSFHDLVREFARDRATADGTATDREDATGRLLDWYVTAVRSAAQTLHPALVRLPYADVLEMFDSDTAARAFLDREFDNMMLVIPYAAASAHPAPSWLITDALRGYFWAYDHRHAWAESASTALAAATASGDLHGQAAIRFSLGTLAERHQRPEESLGQLRIGLALSEQAGWPEGTAGLLNNLANALYAAGDLEAASDSLTRALERNRSLGRRGTVAINLVNLSLIQGRLGHLREAEGSLTEAAAIFRDTNDRVALPVALHNLGNMHQRTGDLSSAEAEYAEALHLYRALGNADGEGLATSSLASLRRDQGRFPEAVGLATTAIAMLSEHHEESSTVMARNTLASILLRHGKTADALEIYRETVGVAEALGLPRPQIEALIGMARAGHRAGDAATAQHAAARALAMAAEHRMPLVEADALIARAEVDTDMDPAHARASATRARAIYQAAGAIPAVAEATTLLAGLSPVTE